MQRVAAPHSAFRGSRDTAQRSATLKAFFAYPASQGSLFV